MWPLVSKAGKTTSRW